MEEQPLRIEEWRRSPFDSRNGQVALRIAEWSEEFPAPGFALLLTILRPNLAVTPA